jgi:hypothetical protein
MSKPSRLIYLLGLFSAFSASAALAAPVFTDYFDTAGSSANYVQTTANVASVDAVTYGFDYSTKGIAEAPTSPGASAATRGVLITVNKGAGVTNGINLTAAIAGVPIVFTEDIKFSFDMWMGYNTADLATSTEIALFGINTDGAGVTRMTSTSSTAATANNQTGSDGLWYNMSGDGGFGDSLGRDVVSYINVSAAAAGARLANNAASLTGLFPVNTPTVGNVAGAPGNRWVHVDVEESGGNIVLKLNGTQVISQANTGPTTGSLFIGYQDPFTTSIPDINKTFIIYDNLVVVPEATSLAFAGLACCASGLVYFVRRRLA